MAAAATLRLRSIISDSSPLSSTVGSLVTMMRVAGGCCLVDEESQIML